MHPSGIGLSSGRIADFERCCSGARVTWDCCGVSLCREADGWRIGRSLVAQRADLVAMMYLAKVLICTESAARACVDSWSALHAEAFAARNSPDTLAEFCSAVIGSVPREKRFAVRSQETRQLLFEFGSWRDLVARLP